MLYSLASKEQTEVPKRRLEQWKEWIAKISKADYDRIVGKINNHCESVKVFISGPLAKELLDEKDWQDLKKPAVNTQDTFGD